MKSAELLLIISIDCDFFVEENPLLDYGHRETNLFLELMWQIRERDFVMRWSTTEKELPLRGDPSAFMFRLLSQFKFGRSIPVSIAESHASIISFLNSTKLQQFEIVNFDAHHDIHYGANISKLKGDFDCGSWASYLMLNKRLVKYTQVYPEWRRRYAESKPSGKWPVSFEFHDEWMAARKKKRKIAGIFICRSGCWVPPCYDEKLNAMVKILSPDFQFDKRAVPRYDANDPGIVAERAMFQKMAQEVKRC